MVRFTQKMKLLSFLSNACWNHYFVFYEQNVVWPLDEMWLSFHKNSNTGAQPGLAGPLTAIELGPHTSSRVVMMGDPSWIRIHDN